MQQHALISDQLWAPINRSQRFLSGRQMCSNPLINHQDTSLFAKNNSHLYAAVETNRFWLCRTTDMEGCTPTEAGRSTGRPGLLLPFPACRAVGTVHWAAPNAVLFFAPLFNARAAPWRPVASSLPQATEFNPGTALPKRWWKTAGQLQD